MPPQSRANLLLGLCCLALAMAVAFLWVPLDTDTGLIEKVRRRISIGDALAPTIAAGFIALGGVLVLIANRNDADQPALTRANLAFVLSFVAFLLVVFALMRWAGPLALALSGDETPYRTLRDTGPWKWIGFGVGGFVLVACLITVLERRFSLRAVLVGALVVLALVAIFDLPFDDLLLPPNGDV